MKFLFRRALILFVFSAVSVFISPFFAEMNPSYSISDEENLSPVKISEILYQLLKKEKWAPVYQSLSSSDEESYPHNIIVTIDNTSADAKDTLLLSDDSLNSNKIKTVIFSFSQNYALKKTEELLNLLSQTRELIQTGEISFNFQLLLTANDNPRISTKDNAVHLTGTDCYSENLSEEDQICALVFLDNEKSSSTIKLIPGGAKLVSPSYLLKSTIKALKTSGLDYWLPSKFVYLYKNGMLSGNKRVTSFLENNIPSLGLYLSISDDNLELYKNLMKELSSVTNADWEKNYDFYRFGLTEIFIPEGLLLILFSVFSFLTLFSLVFMTFRKSARTRQIRRDIAKTWFIIPFMVLFTGLICQVVEWSLSRSNLNFAIILGIKIIISLLFAFLLYSLQVKFHWGTSIESSRFLLQVAAGFALFTFTYSDLTMLLPFFLFFTLVFVGSYFTKKHTILIATILFIVPFIPYLYAIAHYSDSAELSKLKNFSYLQNCLFALILYPFELGWSRILIVFGIFNDQEQLKRKKALKRIIISISITISIYFAAYVTYASFILTHTKRSSAGENTLTIIESPDEKIDFDFSRTTFAGLEMKHLVLNSREKVIRYIISVECQDAAPIYGSNYEYTFDGTNKVYFVLPDNPEGEIEIIYRSDNLYDQKITLEAFYESELNKNLIYHEKQSILVKRNP